MLELDQLVLFVRCRMLGAIVIFAPKAISIDFFIKHLHFSHNFLTFLKICRPSIKYMPFWRHISRLSPHQHVLQTSDFVDFIWNAECLSIIGTLKVNTDRSLILIDRDLIYFTTQVPDHATRMWHKWDITTQVQHGCDTSASRTTRVRHEWKILILITARGKTHLHNPIVTIWQMKDYKKKGNFITRTKYLVPIPKCPWKVHTKNWTS